MAQLQATFAAHGSACHDRSTELKNAINTAASVVDLKAIDLDAGWPVLT